MISELSSLDVERSWAAAGATACRVLGATINSVSEVSKSAGDAAGTVESVNYAGLITTQRNRMVLIDHTNFKSDESCSSYPTPYRHSFGNRSHLIQ